MGKNKIRFSLYSFPPNACERPYAALLFLCRHCIREREATSSGILHAESTGRKHRSRGDDFQTTLADLAPSARRSRTCGKCQRAGNGASMCFSRDWIDFRLQKKRCSRQEKDATQNTGQKISLLFGSGWSRCRSLSLGFGNRNKNQLEQKLKTPRVPKVPTIKFSESHCYLGAAPLCARHRSAEKLTLVRHA